MAWDAFLVGLAAFSLPALGALPAWTGAGNGRFSLAVLCAAATWGAASYCGLYRLPRSGDPRASLRRVPVAALLSALLLWVGSRWLAPAPLGSGASLLCGAAAGFAMSAARLTSAWIARLPVLRHRVVVIGTGELSDRLVALIDAADGLGLELAGVLTRDDADVVGAERVLGRVEELPKILRDSSVQRVIVAEPSAGPPLPMDLLVAAKSSGVPVESGLRLDEASSERLSLRELRPADIVFQDGFAPGPTYEWTTRVVDLVGASLGLLLAAPVLLAAMLAIRIESPGSPIFWQLRSGRGGRPFFVCKLRSMHEDAEAETGAVFTDDGDDRVTKVGRVLRKTRIDELPQLWNVLKGEMSLVGPRPERPEFIDELQAIYPYFSLRHTIRPGITGLAQVRLGYVSDLESWEAKLAHDLYYVKHRSLRLDLGIILATTRTVLLMRGV